MGNFIIYESHFNSQKIRNFVFKRKIKKSLSKRRNGSIEIQFVERKVPLTYELKFKSNFIR